MLSIEFLKILKRKFNYIYFVFTLLVVMFLSYRYEYYSNYLNVEANNYIYEYLLKLVLLFTILILCVNLIFSYREDYKFRVNRIIYNSKVFKIGNLLSKLFSVTFIFTIFYIIQILAVYGYLLYIKFVKISDLLNNVGIAYYFVLSLCIILFATSVALFMISIFNNTNLAVALTVLFFIGSRFLVSYLETFNPILEKLKYSAIGIFNSSLEYLSIVTSEREFLILIICSIMNTVLLFILSFILKIVKQN